MSRYFSIITTILAVLFFLTVGIFLYFNYQGHLCFWAGSNYWAFTYDYFIESLSPAGLTKYFSNFLVLFFRWPIVGVVLLLLPAVLLFVLVRDMANILKIVPFVEVAVLFAPVFLLFMQMNRLFFLYQGFYIVLFYAVVLCYLKFGHTQRHYVLFLSFYPLLFFLLPTGVLLILYFELFLIEWLFFRRQNIGWDIKSFLWFVFVGCVLCLICPLIWQRISCGAIDGLYSLGIDFQHKNCLTISVLLYLVPLMLTFLKVFSSYKKISAKHQDILFVLITVLLVFVTLWQFPYRRFKGFEHYFCVDNALIEKNWARVISLSKGEKQHVDKLFPYVVLAHAANGDLPDHLFDYPFNSNSMFLPPSDRSNTMMTANIRFYTMSCLTNFALSYAFQNSSIRLNGEDIYVLKSLIELNIENGTFDVAEKYLNKLEKTLVYSDECSKIRQKMIPIFHNKPEMLPDSLFFMSEDKLIDLYRLSFWPRPLTQPALDLLLCGMLQRRCYQNFIDTFFRLYPYQNKANLPKAYEEFLIMVPYIGFSCPENNFKISDDTQMRFKKFYDLYSDTQMDARIKLQQMKVFNHTWWYYAVYGK